MIGELSACFLGCHESLALVVFMNYSAIEVAYYSHGAILSGRPSEKRASCASEVAM